jgi:hypothetical protein
MYKYFTSASPPFIDKTNKVFIDQFQSVINEQFELSPTVFTIQEEVDLGSGVLTDVRARVNRAISAYTGKNIGNDFKNLLFKDINHPLQMGQKFYFDNNFWIVYNIESIKNLAASCIVRRCNSQLRWLDINGIRQSEPCAFEYDLSRTNDKINLDNPVLPEGNISIYCQLNEKTKYIKANQRFIFGRVENRIGFRIIGNGVRSFLNNESMDDTTSTLLQLIVMAYQVNPDVDDIVEGYANAYANFDNLSSGSNVGIYDIVVDPNVNYLLQSGSALFDVRYYSGSVIHTGSFVFGISGSFVPTDYYAFAQESLNTFSLYNLQKYGDHTLDILCSGSSGSRILNIELRGEW